MWFDLLGGVCLFGGAYLLQSQPPFAVRVALRVWRQMKELNIFGEGTSPVPPRQHQGDPEEGTVADLNPQETATHNVQADFEDFIQMLAQHHQTEVPSFDEAHSNSDEEGAQKTIEENASDGQGTSRSKSLQRTSQTPDFADELDLVLKSARKRWMEERRAQEDSPPQDPTPPIPLNTSSDDDSNLDDLPPTPQREDE